MNMLLSASFLSELANHMWQTTIVVGIVAVIARAMRGNRACLRHAMWLGASVKFAVPFSLLIAAGSVFEWPRARLASVPAPNLFEITRMVAEPVAAAPDNPWPGLLTWVAGSVWLAGFSIVLLSWRRAGRRSRAMVRSAAPVSELASEWTDVRVSTEAVGPAVFGLVRPVLLLPAGIDARLTREELSAVIAHERAHAERYDNLTTAFHRAVTAVFWFHPFVWWVGRRLIEERERASDEAAVAAGFSPAVYARGLLKVCRSALGAPQGCMAGAYSSNLKTRVEGIMKYDEIRKLHPALRFAVGALAMLSLAGPLAAGFLHPSARPANQEPVAAPVPPGEDGEVAETVELWPDVDVVYIIEDLERAAFEDLETDEERRRFIESFWLRRDPTPGTAGNEYRDEHYRRIEEANRRFSFGDTDGWRSDRGRIYIVYGEPETIQSVVSGAGQPASFATERWRYPYIEGVGANAELTFVDVNRTGDYRLRLPATPPGRVIAGSRTPPGRTIELEVTTQTTGAPAEQATDAVQTASPSEAEPFRVGEGVVAPRVLERVAPRYTPEARRLRTEGIVRVEGVVRRDGSLDVQRVARSPSPELAEAAVGALRQWRFTPGTLGGEPVDVRLNIEVSFNLGD